MTTVRLLLPEPLNMHQLRELRRQFPSLASFPPAELRQRLSKRPTCVLARIDDSQSAALTAAMAELGLEVELFVGEDYTASYIRSVMPSAPVSWQSAERRLELVLRPSFSPELVLRFWTDTNAGLVQLASLGTSIWHTHFNPPTWLRFPPGMEREDDWDPPERPHDETAPVASVDALVDAGVDLPESGEAGGIDGMPFEVDARRGSTHVRRELWSPMPGEAAHELLARAHSLASAALHEPESRERLAELAPHI